MAILPRYSNRSAYVLAWLAGVCLMTLAVDLALLHSKEPEILFWSLEKFLAFTILGAVGACMFWVAVKLLRPETLFPFRSPRAPEILFLCLLVLLLFNQFADPASTGGDLEYHMEGLIQYVRGEVHEFNALGIPIKNWDLAQDRVEPIVWHPPGPMIILLPLLKLGISPEWAARLLFLAAFACGGVGFLKLTRKLGVGLPAQLTFATALAFAPLSRDGLGIGTPTSADNVGLAIFPWLALATLHLLERFQ